MSNIVINYIILNSIKPNRLTSIIEACRSKQHNVSIVFNDFSLNKQVADQLKNYELDDIKVSVINRDYEDSQDAMSIVTKNFISYSDSDITSIVYENLEFEPKIFDAFDFEIFDNYGFIYGDYSVQNIRCYLRSHASNTKLSIPFVFWSTEKIIKNIEHEDVLEYLFNNYMGYHIPKSICTIISNDE